jgi:hypothetical protein
MNIPENKAKFFAQYWGQKVLRITPYELVQVGISGWNLKHEDFYLELTPISAITDEDAIEVVNCGHEIEFLEKGWRQKESVVIFDYKPKAVDYLRSRGYALPWMGISVEDQVKFGWVKLKES